MSTKPIPDGYDSLIPYLVVNDAARAIEFYKQVFGATELSRMNYPGGTREAHAELKIRNHVMMLGDECQEMGVRAPKANADQPPSGVMIYVTDTDALYNKALRLGAKGIMAPADMFWGDRYAKFLDPFGHQWSLGTHQRDVSPEECAKAMAEWGKEKVPA
jgi:PhnB protein